MHNNITRSRSKVASTSCVLGIAIAITLCAAIYGASTRAPVSQVRASAADSGAISSSPSSGPVGTTITVSGSGWSQTDGTPVYFGYIANSNCSIDSNEQNGSFSAGAFSGWLRWPQSSPQVTYTVCAIISGSAQFYTAGSFTVLSTSAPQVSIAPGALQENQKATITATNYLPSGTSVTFYWATTGGMIERTLGGATSNSSGTASLSLSIPITTLASGQYHVEAAGGGGQPPALFSSSNFSYSAPVVQPSPTPSPQTTPSPSPTPNPTQTATATVTASATAASSPTAGSTPTGVPTLSTGGAGVTPTTATNGTGLSTTATTGSGGNGASTGQPNNVILFSAIIGSLAVLIALLAVALARRRKQTRQLAKLRPSSPALPPNAGLPPIQSMPGASPMPGQFLIPGMTVPLPQPPTQAAPMPALAGQYAAGGTPPAPPLQAPLPYRSLLRPMTPPPAGDLPPNGDGNGNGMLSAPADPALDAMRREAQVGLYVAPMPRASNGVS